MEFPKGRFVSIVGESGCGKSTVAAVLMGRNRGFGGSVEIGGRALADIRESELMKNITYVSHQSYLFKGTVRENLRMGKPDASDPELWEVLERVNRRGSSASAFFPVSSAGGVLLCQKFGKAESLVYRDKAV